MVFHSNEVTVDGRIKESYCLIYAEGFINMLNYIHSLIDIHVHLMMQFIPQRQNAFHDKIVYNLPVSDYGPLTNATDPSGTQPRYMV